MENPLDDSNAPAAVEVEKLEALTERGAWVKFEPRIVNEDTDAMIVKTLASVDAFPESDEAA